MLHNHNSLEFLNAVVPHGSYYCTSSIGASTPWRDKCVSNLNTVLNVARANSANGLNTYFALSSFKQGWHTNGTKKAFRVQSNALCQKALWLDIDVGKAGCSYTDWQQAAGALVQFLKQTGLPMPWIVHSGHGLHVYWAFTSAVKTELWRPMARMLKELCVYYSFDVDHTRTTDPASVLRVPGTINYDFKGTYGGVAKPVQIIKAGVLTSPTEVAKVLLTAVKRCGLHVSCSIHPTVDQSTPRGPSTFDGALFDMDSFSGAQKHPYRIIKECKQVQTAGLGSYAQWYNMMLVMKHCAFGERAVHDISRVDKRRYDYANVQQKYQQAVDGGCGPCKCTTFNEKTPGICTKCPYWGKITTPLQLGDPYEAKKPITLQAPVVARAGDTAVVSIDAPAAMEVVPFANKEFAVVPGKGVVWYKKERVTSGGDGDEESIKYIVHDHLIADIEIYIHSLCIDATNSADVRRSYIIRKKVAGRAPEDILFDVSTDIGPMNLQKWLANHGMLPVHPKYAKPMGDFMQTYLAAIQNKLPEVYVRDSFGWVENQDTLTGETYPGFVVADKMYTAKGCFPVRLNERAEYLAKDFKPAGALEVWKHIPKMYRMLDQKFPALMMCAAMAAPFMKYGNGVATNVAYSLWDVKGGKGKSTVLEACASIWGNPVTMIQTKSDTVSSRFQKFATYKNLPIFVDEITNMRDEEMSNLIYDIVNGREKSRSTSTGTGLARQGQWATTTLFTSNRSLYEMLKGYRSQSDATCMRVIEMQCDFKDYTGTKTHEYISQISRAIRRNYGVAGPAFLDYILAHPEVFDEVQTWADEFVLRHIQSSDERFWLYGVAIPLAVGRIACRAGLFDYDIDGWLMPYVINELLPSLRKAVHITQNTAQNILSDFLFENLDSTLTVATAVRPAKMVDPGVANGIDAYVKAHPARKLQIRREIDTNTYYISTKAFTRWCLDNNYSVSVILYELQRQGLYCGKLQCSLGKCVKAYDRSRTQTFKIRLQEDITDE